MKNILLVLNYNNFEQTKRFVDESLCYFFFNSIVIVDNASKNNSAEILSSYFKPQENVKVISSPSNNGYAQGNNYGLKYIEENFDLEDIVFIANPDVSLNIDSLQAIKSFMEEEKNVGVVTTNILGQQVAWRSLDYYKSVVIESFFFRKIFSHKYIELKYYSKITEKMPVDVVSGAFFAVKLSAMIEIQGFDPNTFLYMEEDILALKIKSSNRQSYVLGTQCIKHEGGTSTKNVLSEIKQKKVLNKSKSYFYREYLKKNYIELLLFKIVSTIDVAILYLKSFFRKENNENHS